MKIKYVLVQMVEGLPDIGLGQFCPTQLLPLSAHRPEMLDSSRDGSRAFKPYDWVTLTPLRSQVETGIDALERRRWGIEK
jgi:hypothetical protein